MGEIIRRITFGTDEIYRIAVEPVADDPTRELSLVGDVFAESPRPSGSGQTS